MGYRESQQRYFERYPEQRRKMVESHRKWRASHPHESTRRKKEIIMMTNVNLEIINGDSESIFMDAFCSIMDLWLRRQRA